MAWLPFFQSGWSAGGGGPSGHRCLFVYSGTIDSATEAGNDNAYIHDRLVTLGYTVTTILDTAAEPSLSNYDVVVIANSADSTNVGTKYKNATIPILYLIGTNNASIGNNHDWWTGSAANGNSNITLLNAHASDGGLTGQTQFKTTAVDPDTGLASNQRYSTVATHGLISGTGITHVFYNPNIGTTGIVQVAVNAGAAMLNSHTAESKRLWIGWLNERTIEVAVAYATTWRQPFDAAMAWLSPITTGTAAWGKRWDGAAHVALTTRKRWDGAAFVDLTIAKRWDGAAWVDIS